MKGVFVNPVIDGDYPDPTLVRDGQDYYLTYSTGNQGPGMAIMHSRDLVHWRTITKALRAPARGYAAPELIRHDGLFYLYYPEHGTNWVVTAERPEGPWSEPADLKVGRIDPGHVVGADGRRYLYLSGGYAAELTQDGLALKESPRPVYDGWSYGEEYRTEGFFLESPKFFARDGVYYMVSAQGGTSGPSTAHMAVVARADHPMGPWENSPYNPLVHTESRDEKWWCKGHGTIFEDAYGQWYIIYHAYEKGFLSRGRKVLLERIRWTDDGWPVLDGGDAAAQIPLPEGENAGTDDFSDDFSAAALKPTWYFWGDYDANRISVGGGELRLTAAGASPGASNPMTFPAGDHSYEITARVRISGRAGAGLILFYNEQAYAGVGIGNRGIETFKYARPYIPIEEDMREAELRIINDQDEVEFAYRTKGSEWKKIQYALEISGYNHNALGGYYGIRPGLYCYGEGEAVFSEFRYRAL